MAGARTGAVFIMLGHSGSSGNHGSCAEAPHVWHRHNRIAIVLGAVVFSVDTTKSKAGSR